MKLVARYVVEMFPNPFQWLALNLSDKQLKATENVHVMISTGNYAFKRLNPVNSSQAELSCWIFEEKGNVFLE